MGRGSVRPGVMQTQPVQQVGFVPDQENRRGQFKKTKMCKFHIIGMCAKGSLCPFAHNTIELQDLPDLACTKLCKTLLQTGACNDPRCTYAHNKDQLRATSTFHKTKLCRFAQSGFCSLGSKCNFAHSVEELHSPDPPVHDIASQRPRACHNWDATGRGANLVGGGMYTYGVTGTHDDEASACNMGLDIVETMKQFSGITDQDVMNWQAQMGVYPYCASVPRPPMSSTFAYMADASLLESDLPAEDAVGANSGDALFVTQNDSEVSVKNTFLDFNPVPGGALRSIQSAAGRLDNLGFASDDEGEATLSSNPLANVGQGLKASASGNSMVALARGAEITCHADDADSVVNETLLDTDDMLVTGGPLRLVRSAEGRLDLMGAVC